MNAPVIHPLWPSIKSFAFTELTSWMNAENETTKYKTKAVKSGLVPAQ